MKTALLINKGYADNLGDQSIKFVLEKMLEQNNYNVEFSDFTLEKKYSDMDYFATAKDEMKKDNSINLLRKIHRYLMKYSFYKGLLWSYFNRNALKKEEFSTYYDLIIVGGGQLILSNSIFPVSMKKWSRFMNKYYTSTKKVVFGVGAAGRFNLIEKLLYKSSLSKFNLVYLRDQESIKLIRDTFNIQTKYVPDVVFNISKVYRVSNTKENIALIGITDYLVYKRYNKPLISKDEYYKEWEQEVIKYKQKGFTVELFYTTSRDLSETILFKKYLEQNSNVSIEILKINNLEDLIHSIAQSSVIVSGRMHALIIGYSYGCKVIPYIVSDKIRTFNNEYILKNRKLEDIQKEIEESFRSCILN